MRRAMSCDGILVMFVRAIIAVQVYFPDFYGETQVAEGSGGWE